MELQEPTATTTTTLVPTPTPVPLDAPMTTRFVLGAAILIGVLILAVSFYAFNRTRRPRP